MLAHVGQGWRVIDLSVADAARFVANVNKTPPQTDYTADEVHVAQKPGEPRTFAYFVVNGCVSNVIEIPVDMLPSLISERRAPVSGREL